MRKIIAFLCAAFILQWMGTALAMNMSLGKQYGGVLRMSGGNLLFIDKAISNTGTHPIFNGNKVMTELYQNGTATFGDPLHPLLLTYTPNGILSDISGTKEICRLFIGITFFEIRNDVGVTMYLLRCEERYNISGNNRYILCGYRSDGKFVIYFDTKQIIKRYGITEGLAMEFSPVISGDKISLIYNVHKTKHDNQKDGELNFVWDEKAQWFSVENVTY